MENVLGVEFVMTGLWGRIKKSIWLLLETRLDFKAVALRYEIGGRKDTEDCIFRAELA
jgi:hypothetical protein